MGTRAVCLQQHRPAHWNVYLSGKISLQNSSYSTTSSKNIGPIIRFRDIVHHISIPGHVLVKPLSQSDYLMIERDCLTDHQCSGSKFKVQDIGYLMSKKQANIVFNLRLWHRPPLRSSGQSSWLQIQRIRVRFPALLDFLSSVSGTGSTQPREYNWRATSKK
jgi:hypothetical protein